MLTIQEAGLSILSDHPGPIYFVCGEEYGIKEQYILHLQEVYNSKHECSSVQEVIDIMSKKHLFPLPPQLYVVRYDQDFITRIDKLSSMLKSINMIGTLVCIYSDPKHLAKLDKHVPEYTFCIDQVDSRFVEKYLMREYKLDPGLIKKVVSVSPNYGQARKICQSLSMLSPDMQSNATINSIEQFYSVTNSEFESKFKVCVASKSFPAMLQCLDSNDTVDDSILYIILQTMIDIEKNITNKYADSPIKQYTKLWTIPDIYYMFMICYDNLSKIRSGKITDIYSQLVYLCAIISLKTIPSPEAII